jgi:TPR repeat protein
MRKSWAVAALAALGALPALAATSTENTCPNMSSMPIPAEIMTAGFYDAHPDLRWRNAALDAYKKRNYATALRNFKRAANYADKFSQFMVAHLYWEGLGVAADQPLAYAWVDLAAERGYHDFAAQRESYWAQLDGQQRAEAVHRGQAVYTRYSDSVTKPNLERALRLATRNMTGGRTGLVTGPLSVTDVSGNFISAAVYYDQTYYQPEMYWCYEDAYWSRPMSPSVEVGLPQTTSPDIGRP